MALGPAADNEQPGRGGRQRRCGSTRARGSASLVPRTRVGLDETELQTARLCAGGVPANAGDGHTRLDDASPSSDDATKRCVKVGDRDGDQRHGPTAAEGRIADGAHTTIDSRLLLRSGLDAEVLVGHVELVEAPTQDLLEEGASEAYILDGQIEVGRLHGRVPQAAGDGRKQGGPCDAERRSSGARASAACTRPLERSVRPCPR